MDTNFIEHLKKYLSSDDINSLVNELNKEQTYSSIVFDEEKIDKDTLISLYPSLIPHPIVENAFLFNKKIDELGKSLLFEIGAFYILEPCSPLVSQFLDLNETDLVLDVAASPGGKSIHTSFIMHNKGQIISNEISYSRAQVLSSNSEKYGRKNITVCSSDIFSLSKIFPNTFSKIILDAPCSGSGMFRKESKMKDDWTYQKVLSCAATQKELILEAYKMLIPGGMMMYSTCSYSYEEDEEVILYLLENTDAELVNIPHFEGEYRSSLHQTVHLLPHLFNGEGHYIAKIKKPGKLSYPILPTSKKKYSLLNNPIEEELFTNKNNEVFLTNHILDLKGIRILRNGIKVGTLDKKIGLIFDHNYSRLKNHLLPQIEVNEKEAKDFIYGLSIPTNYKNGFVIISYLSIPFALGKVSNGQIKNHYPKGLRKKI